MTATSSVECEEFRLSVSAVPVMPASCLHAEVLNRYRSNRLRLALDANAFRGLDGLMQTRDHRRPGIVRPVNRDDNTSPSARRS